MLVEAALTSKQVNARIHDAAGSAALDSDVDFLCECGCMRMVVLTPTEYALGGAWLPGHCPEGEGS